MARGAGYVPSSALTLNYNRHLGAFDRENPLFRPAEEQIPLMQPWHAFPGGSGVRITQAIVDDLARIVEQRATPDRAFTDMTAEVRRLLPKT